MQLMRPRLLTLDDAAHYLAVGKGTIEVWIHEGKIRTFRLPGIRDRQYLERTLIKIEELDRMVDEGVEI